MIKSFGKYIVFIIAALLLSALAYFVEPVREAFLTHPEGLYLSLALLFGVGYGLNYFAPKTVIPSFVWAIFFGMALQPLLITLTSDTKALSVLVELLAALVLFGGGIEVPFGNFKKYFAPIASLSILGTALTVVLFSLVLEVLGGAFGLVVPSIIYLILGGILASIDPTAIIPSLKSLQFKKPFLRDIAISESAVNDVAGTVITRFFIVAALAAAGYPSVMSALGNIVSTQMLNALAMEILWGVIVGMVGALMLRKWAENLEKTGHRKTDPALFFAVPIFAFAAGSVVGGSGFLAAFVAGLLFDAYHPTKEVTEFFESFGDGFIKPVIFLLLGAVVPVGMLVAVAPFGILAALIFMFVIRPIVVFISLAPWSIGKRGLFSWQELTFLSFIRETGAIPAVLILVAIASGIPGAVFLFTVGMWVIILTLTIEPPLTGILARTLGITKK